MSLGSRQKSTNIKNCDHELSAAHFQENLKKDSLHSQSQNI